ncbi:MAG: THUMP domain-containing protein [Acidimicrobiia bacterium]|nr:THUMP domain-containing protein [Acidimicrobiia bacterium]
MDHKPGARSVHVTSSGDVYLKSRRTQRGLIARARRNLEIAVQRVGYVGDLERVGMHRFVLTPGEDRRSAVVEAARPIFGFGSIDVVESLPFSSFDHLAEAVAKRSAERVAGRTFAVRVKRRGGHEWRSPELASAVGTMLVAAGGRVDLTAPEEEVSVRVIDDRAYLVTEHHVGAGGLPLGTQESVLCLLSGGFDSVVAAWMMMSRGCPVDFVHFSLNCAQSDHALAVGRALWDTWGHGTDPTVHLVDFQPVKDALVDHVEPRLRQITLKVMMGKAASAIAEQEGIQALVTGDSIGQVSSQTLPHLVAVSEASEVPILRPLAGLPKETIIGIAREVGTAELSARAREVCDLSEGRPVATSARRPLIDRSADRVPEAVLEDVVATAKSFRLRDWSPGQM